MMKSWIFKTENFLISYPSLKIIIILLNNVNDIFEQLADLKNADPKAKLFVSQVQKGESYIYLPDPDSKDFVDQMQLASLEGTGFADGIGGEAASSSGTGTGE